MKKTQSKKSHSSVGRAVLSTKRLGKKTLREILLSKVFHSSFKVFIGFLLVTGVFYSAYSFVNTTFVNDVVVSESEILSRVGKHISLPDGSPSAVVRVQNGVELRKQNKLYENIKDGDYIIMYPDIAIVYDLRNNIIVATKELEK